MINVGLSDVLLILPMIVIFLASLAPITVKVLRQNKEQPALATLGQGLGGLIAGAILLFVFAGNNNTAFNNALVFDGVTLWMGLIALMGAAAAMLIMYENPAITGKQYSEFTFLTLSSVVGMLILVSAIDLLMVFIGLETMSLALYLMIAMSNEGKLSKESALKYFILGSFASAIFLYGVAYIFGSTGTTLIPEILTKTEELMQTNRMFLFGMGMIVLGFCFKVSIAPFHAWTPDVYQGAPTPVTAYMATAVKAVSFAAFLRIIATKPLVASDALFEMLQWLAVITMIVGNVAAILQNNLKRMLAYSSVSHSGYVLVGLITAGVSARGEFAASGVMFYMVGYSLMTLGAFAVASALEKNENSIINIDDLAGLSKRNPIMALAMTIFMLSLAGIPPTIGFFGKFYMFSAAIKEGLIWLAIWGVLNSVISVYYYLRPIVVMYMKEGEAETAEHPLHATRFAIIISAIIILSMGIFSGPVFKLFETSL